MLIRVNKLGSSNSVAGNRIAKAKVEIVQERTSDAYPPPMKSEVPWIKVINF